VGEFSGLVRNPWMQQLYVRLHPSGPALDGEIELTEERCAKDLEEVKLACVL
jgi:hypothetical protein